MSGWPIGYVANAGFETMPPADVVSTLSELGYSAVDWTLDHFDPMAQPPEDLVELAKLADSAGLGTPQLMVHQDFVRVDPALYEQTVTKTERAAEACAAAGIPTIGVLTGPNCWEEGHARVGQDLSEERAWELALGALARVLACAERVGVTVSLEPCWGTLARDRYRTEYALSRLDSPALGLTLDPSHFVMSGDDVPELIHAWGDRIRHVHLKDAFGSEGEEGIDFTFLVPGAGSVRWAPMFDALRNVGYEGSMSVEFEAFALLEGPLHNDPAAAAQLTRQLVTGLLAEGT
jgi:sugar phosphate isomerase/epimerase